MDLIREIAGDKLVIMVTHNSKLAEDYADRIIKFEDGRVVSDSMACLLIIPVSRTIEKMTKLPMQPV